MLNTSILQVNDKVTLLNNNNKLYNCKILKLSFIKSKVFYDVEVFLRETSLIINKLDRFFLE